MLSYKRILVLSFRGNLAYPCNPWEHDKKKIQNPKYVIIKLFDKSSGTMTSESKLVGNY
jgi:hypothetical protein